MQYSVPTTTSLQNARKHPRRSECHILKYLEKDYLVNNPYGGLTILPFTISWSYVEMIQNIRVLSYSLDAATLAWILLAQVAALACKVSHEWLNTENNNKTTAPSPKTVTAFTQWRQIVLQDGESCYPSDVISRLTFCGWFLCSTWYTPPRKYKSLPLQRAVCVKTDASVIGHGLELVLNWKWKIGSAVWEIFTLYFPRCNALPPRIQLTVYSAFYFSRPIYGAQQRGME